MSPRGPQKCFIAKLVVRPELRQEFETLARELNQLTREGEPDTLFYDLWRSAEDPDTFMYVASFRDAEAFDVHMATPFHERLIPPLMECLAQDMELSFYTPLE